jgi:UDP-glucuronate 4-epimerase
MAILVTGAAGFIGFHLARRLLENGQEVIGYDNMNDYYNPHLKEARLTILQENSGFFFYRNDLCNLTALNKIFKHHTIEKVCHLAAQAGVRYSLQNPFAYQKSNLEGFLNIIECSKQAGVQNFVYASSSSVYGNNQKLPFAIEDNVDHPICLYAATKKSNELIAHCYAHLYHLPCTGLRFFTVYGPYGRPDMALFIFTQKILNGEPIDVYNYGNMKRDFTYIDDIINGVTAALDKISPYALFNLGNHKSESLVNFIQLIEKYTGRRAQLNLLEIQPGDIPETYADIHHAQLELGFNPKTSIEVGIQKFVDWYKEYYQIN